MDFTLNAAADPDSNPYTPAGLGFVAGTSARNYAGTGMCANASGAGVISYHNVTYLGTTLVSQVTWGYYLSSASTNSSTIGCVVKSGGNAGAFLGVRINGLSLTWKSETAGSVETSLGTGTLSAMTTGDVITVEYNKSTGAITLKQNGVVVNPGTGTNISLTYAGESSLSPGWTNYFDNGDVPRISLWETSGIAASGGSLIRPRGMSGGMQNLAGGMNN